MSAALDDPAVRAYLIELRRALADRPAEERELVLDGVRQHMVDALRDAPADGARVQRVLDDLGDPVAIAAESSPAEDAAAGPGVPGVPVVPASVSLLDRPVGSVLIVLVLAFGGLVVPVLGWAVGVLLLWASQGWQRVDKLIGTLAAPALLVLLSAALLLLHATAGPAGSTGTVGPEGSTSLGPLLPAVYDLVWSAFIAAPVLQLAVGVFLLLRFRPRG